MKKYFVLFSDKKNVKKISESEFHSIVSMSKFYKFPFSTYEHYRGTTLVVSFPQHFV